MSSKELLRGYEVDLNTLFDSFQKEVQDGGTLDFQTFKGVWKSMHLSFLLVTASEEAEIESYIQDLFMCVLDRFDMPSPLRYGKLFGDVHKPRLRRPLLNPDPEKQTSASEEGVQGAQDMDIQLTKSIFTKEIPDFPKSSLTQFITFEERVGVIYALYCIYKEQCLEPRSCIHIPIDLFQQLVEFIPQLKERGILDALYILQYLQEKSAFVCGVVRRPPGFLSLPLEGSEFEAQGLRDLAFHLKTSLQDLGRIEKIEKLCDEYASLQHRVVHSKLGHELKASKLMTFNADVGTWLKSVMSQETSRVHQGITGLTPKKSRATCKDKNPVQQKKQIKKKVTKKPSKPSVGTVELSQGDDSWGIQMQGIPKAARLVMIRDKKRRRENQDAEEVEDAELETQQMTMEEPTRRELRSEDFYQACSDFRTMQTEEKSPSLAEASSDDEDLRNWRKTVESLNEELQRSERSSK